MPMGIVSPEEFESELKNSSVGKSKTVKIPEVINEQSELGRGKGSIEVPNGLRKLIGDESISNGRSEAIDLAKSFGISSSSVSAYSNGSTSTKSYDKQPNKEIITKAKNRISVKARNRLTMALNHITEDKLAVAKLRDVAGVAKDMSTIIKNMDESSSDKERGITNNGPSFIFYSPKLRSEQEFEAITVKE